MANWFESRNAFHPEQWEAHYFADSAPAVEPESSVTVVAAGASVIEQVRTLLTKLDQVVTADTASAAAPLASVGTPEPSNATVRR